MRNIAPRLFPLLIIGLLGLVFVGAGLYMAIFAAGEASAEAARVAALLPVSRADFEAGAPGQEILLEGGVSPRNRPRFRNFVAYIRYEYRGSDDDGDPLWSEDERVTPPLLIELSSGPVQIGNADYRLGATHESWEEEGGRYWNGTTGEGSKRYDGLLVGRPLLALGTLERGPEGNQLRAEFVFGGTQAEYVISRRETARFLPIFGSVFAAVGALLLAVGLWLVLRR